MQGKPHILHVFSSAGLYGAEYVALGLMPALRAHGIDCTLLCINNPRTPKQYLYERARELGLATENIPCAGRFDLATIRRLRAIIRAQPNAIVHTHGYKGTFYASLATRGMATPKIATLHGWVTKGASLELYQWLETRLLRGFQQLCIVSEEQRAPLLRAGVDGEKIRFVQNGVDTRRFRPDVAPLPRSEFGIPDDAFVFGAAMRLSEEKNPVGLVEAFAALAPGAPQAWLVISGDGPLHASIEERAAALGVASRLRLLGARNDLEHFYTMLDCFVLPSLREGLPLALLEAMASARPVVCSSVAQIPDVVSGLDVQQIPPGDESALVAALRHALAVRSPAHALRERVEVKYSVTRMARDYATIYEEVASRHESLAA
jgi:glycosyltransferase involved in cell wall biosynthesis